MEKEQVPERERKEKLVRRLSTPFRNVLERSKEVLRNFFLSPQTEEKSSDAFAHFSSEDYLQLYYGIPLNPEIAKKISEIVPPLETQHTTEAQIPFTRVDISEFGQSLQESMPIQESSVESVENYAIYDFMLRRALPQILRFRPEDHLNMLDVGGGPTIYQHLPLLSVARSITHAEYLESNRSEVKKWKEGKTDFDWSQYFSFVRNFLRANTSVFASALPEVKAQIEKLLQGDADVLLWESALREKLLDVVPVDVFQKDLGMKEENFDVVNVPREGSVELLTSNFCIESATASEEQWKDGMANIARKVAANGFLLMTAIRDASWYAVGNHRMPSYPVTAENVSAEIIRQGFEILELGELIGSDKEKVGYDGMVFILARKI